MAQIKVIEDGSFVEVVRSDEASDADDGIGIKYAERHNNYFEALTNNNGMSF